MERKRAGITVLVMCIGYYNAGKYAVIISCTISTILWVINATNVWDNGPHTHDHAPNTTNS